VRGAVQGVGFRPHVYRTAVALGLSGSVRNDGDGVTMEIEGENIELFAERLTVSLPPLARIDATTVEYLAPGGDHGFRIAESDGRGGDAVFPADVAVCESCLQELFDPGDRRYLHPFIACSDCGPRYSMARRLPYDRGNTTMRDFGLCRQCRGEYEDPDGRRLHAEPIACHDCGPRLSHTVAKAAAALAEGQIVAIKGVGGYHLACDARNVQAVAHLRQRKHRDERPFAVMLLNSASAAAQVDMDANAHEILASPERPVLVLRRATTSDLPSELAPGLDSLGLMLPYTPLHYLLFHALLGSPRGTGWLQCSSGVALVMTSANRTGDCLLTDDDEAGQELVGVADLILSHNRQIEHGSDDSVLVAAPGVATMLRRGRGYAPAPLSLHREHARVLALGAHLKNTICALRGNSAFLSPHIGDLDSQSTRALLGRRAREMLHDLRLRPSAIACDLHPDYASTRLAQELAESLELPLFPVQHHHAHIAAVAAVHDCREPLLGLALDGHGLGEDGENRGGELLELRGAGFRRLASLRPLALPGGERAVREPWRIALALPLDAARLGRLKKRLRGRPLLEAVRRLAVSGRCPQSTAAGRYFDAAAALLGVCQAAGYEAAAAMRLESCCRELRVDRGLYTIREGQLDLYPLLARLLDCSDPSEGSALFHGTLVDALARWVIDAAARREVTTVALGGGCFLNRVLAGELPPRLREAGLRVLLPGRDLTPGDGGISLGQAWVAARLLAGEDVALALDKAGA